MCGARKQSCRSEVTYFLLLSFSTFCSNGCEQAPPPIGEQSSALGYLTDDYSGTGTPASVSYPDAGASYTDPYFGTKIIRVTDNIGGHTPGSINSAYAGPCQNAYATWNAFNENDSRLLVECDGHALIYNFDSTTDTPSFYTEISGGQSYSVQAEGAVWDRTDPNIIYALGAPTSGSGGDMACGHPPRMLYKIDVTASGSSRFTLLKDFTTTLGSTYNSLDPCWGIWRLTMPTANSNQFVFVVRDESGVQQTWSDVVYYNNTYGTTTTWSRPSDFYVHGADINLSGYYVVIYNWNSSGSYVGDTAFWDIGTGTTNYTVPNATDKSGGHDDTGTNIFINDDVFNSGILSRSYQTGTGSGYLHTPVDIFHYYTDNTHTQPNGCIPDHISYRDSDGTYAAVSTYQQNFCSSLLDPHDGHCDSGCGIDYSYPFANEIFLVKADGTHFYRIAHTRSTVASCDDSGATDMSGDMAGESCYGHQTFGAIDSFGHYVVYHSDLGDAGSSYSGLTDVFIAKVPSALWTTCIPPETLCGVGECANTQTDANNCGECGYACASGDTCVAGFCTGPCVEECGSTCCNASDYCYGGFKCYAKWPNGHSCTTETASDCISGCCWDNDCEPPDYYFCHGGGVESTGGGDGGFSSPP